MIRFAAAVALVAALSSSCMIRLDKKSILKEVSGYKLMTKSDVIMTRDTSVAPFHALTVSGGVKVRLVQDPVSEKISITGPDNFVPHVTLNVEDGVLHIGSDLASGRMLRMTDGDIKVEVHAREITAVSLAGSVEFECDGLDLPGKDFAAALAGSGELDLGFLNAASVSVAVAGSAEVDIDRLTAGDVDMSVAGSGEISVDGMDVDEVNAEVGGSGEVDLNGKAEKASYKVTGSGEIDASELTCGTTATKVGGSGSIRYRDASGNVVEVTR